MTVPWALLLLAGAQVDRELPAAPAPAGRRHALATRVLQPPRIDGKLDDPAWQEGPALDGFVQRMPDEGKAASERTEVRIVYDDRALYVAFRCHDSQAWAIQPRLGRRDDLPESDWVAFAVDPFHDRRNAYIFVVNSAGVQLDGNLAEGQNDDYSWDGIWDARTSIDREGWSAEIAIPLATLRFPRAPVQTWGFHVRRYISRKKEQDDWSLIRMTDSSFIGRFADLDGIEGVRPALSLQLLPYLSSTLRVSHSPDSLGPPDGLRGQAGIDLKYALTGTLTLDGTLNPDFGQVEVDPEVVNLSAYEVQFPEKRPFFLEGADIFQSQLVYTRRIGAPPPAPDPQHGGDIVALDPSARIVGALKLTGNLRPGTAVGLLSAYVDGTSAVERVGPGYLSPSFRLEATPPTWFNLARVRQVVGGQSTLGLVATSVVRDGTGADAHAVGADFDVRGSSDYTANGGVAWSMTPACDAARTASFRAGSGCDALGVNFFGGKTGGELQLYQSFLYFGSEFDINDLGYLQHKLGNQYVSQAPHLGYFRARPLGAWSQIGADVSWLTAWDPNAGSAEVAFPMVQNQLLLSGFGMLKNNWRTGGVVAHALARFDDAETRQNALVRLYRRPDRDLLSLWVRTNDSRRFWVELGNSFDVEDGTWTESPSLDAMLHVGGRLRLRARLAWQQWFGRKRWIATGDDGYPLVGALELEQLEATLRATAAFSRDLTLQVFSQLLRSVQHYPHVWELMGPSALVPCDAGSACPDAAAAGSFDQDLTSLIVNAVARWEFRPGSTLYVVYTHNHQVSGASGQLAFGRALDSLGARPADNVVAIKLSYLWAL